MKLFKTIRFKLTLWYSTLLILLSLVFVITINIVITTHYKRDPINHFINKNIDRPFINRMWRDLDEDRKMLIRDYRYKDLVIIRQISAWTFIPLTALSFVGGYFIAGQMLNPLKKLNKATSEITAKDLKKQIAHENTGDEISELINNFNSMISRLKESFESQKQFVENASHELKTPLAIIQTNLDSALNDGSISKKEMISFIQTSLRSTKFMDDLIEDLLLLSLIDKHVKMEKVNIVKVLKNSTKQLQTLSRKKDISLTLEIKDNVKDLEIRANKVLLQRAIMNVIENAIKYSPKDKKIWVTLKQNNSYLFVRVKDQGIGIQKKEIKKIFERFYRVDKSRSRKTGGSGLGLAITKKIINLHNGKITVKSTKKQGTSFNIKFLKKVQ